MALLEDKDGFVTGQRRLCKRRKTALPMSGKALQEDIQGFEIG